MHSEFTDDWQIISSAGGPQCAINWQAMLEKCPVFVSVELDNARWDCEIFFLCLSRRGICLLSPTRPLSILKPWCTHCSDNSCCLGASSLPSKQNEMYASSVLLHYDSYRIMITVFNTLLGSSDDKSVPASEVDTQFLITFEQFWLCCFALQARSPAVVPPHTRC